jgi:DNA-binding winged helix-turn-helix (wHTH) protein/Tol biopolymer transport system component
MYPTAGLGLNSTEPQVIPVPEPEQGTRMVRFGVFEVDLQTAELRKQGVRIRLPGQSFQVLEALLLRPGELVTREELREKLWPADTFGDFEHGLNAAVNRVREALGDSSDNPRFVETLPRRGYRFIAPVSGGPRSAAAGAADNVVPIAPPGPAGTAPEASPSKPRGLKLAAATAILVCVIAALAALLIAWQRIPPAVPVVESVQQLTDDGQPKESLFTDGSRIYLNEGPSTGPKITQVSVSGGSTAPVDTGFALPFVAGISRDGSALLVWVVPELSRSDGPEEALWSKPLPAGEPRRLGRPGPTGADAFPDGRIVFSQLALEKDPTVTEWTSDLKDQEWRTDFLIADKDGSIPHRLFSLPGTFYDVSVSPGGQRILLTQQLNDDRTLFELEANGTGLREIRKLGSDERNFRWSSDEKYLVYQSGTGRQSDIWLLPMKTGPFRRPGEPIRLTNGPMPYSDPCPSRNGKQIFVLGTQRRGELVRYDMISHAFKPFLSGISATDPTFSRDGKWVAYASYSDHTLWRSRGDGTERLQLTFPPMDVGFPSISPDGTRVSFFTNKGDLFVIGMEGGMPRKVSDDGFFASWSPDGNYLFYPTPYPGEPFKITDVRTGKATAVPLLKDFEGGFWLTQDILVSRNQKHTNFVTFNLKTLKFDDLGPGPFGEIENFMISPDGKYICFTTGGAEPMAMRIRVGEHKLETIASLKDFHRVVDYGGTQINVAPDGSPVFTRDTGYQEVYALNVRWP